MLKRYKSDVEVIARVLECLAIVGAALWAFYVFIYEKSIYPKSLAPNVVVTCELQPLRGNDLQTPVHARVVLTNPGTVPAHVLVGWLNVASVAVISRQMTTEAFLDEARGMFGADTIVPARLMRDGAEDSMRVVFSGTLTGRPMMLEPGESRAWDLMLFVDKRDAGMLRAAAGAYVGRDTAHVSWEWDFSGAGVVPVLRDARAPRSKAALSALTKKHRLAYVAATSEVPLVDGRAEKASD